MRGSRFLTGDNTEAREDTHRRDDAAHASTQALEIRIGPRVASLGQLFELAEGTHWKRVSHLAFGMNEAWLTSEKNSDTKGVQNVEVIGIEWMITILLIFGALDPGGWGQYLEWLYGQLKSRT